MEEAGKPNVKDIVRHNMSVHLSTISLFMDNHFFRWSETWQQTKYQLVFIIRELESMG